MLKHKDDIRRRLTIAEVPKPPADLVQKIKHDIPKHFTSMTAKQVEQKPREASPLWSFWGMSWQLAAAILVLVGFTWAVFEAYQSEMSKVARVADAKDVMSVEEFEAQVTDPSETVRIDGPIATAEGRRGEVKKEQRTPATASPQTTGGSFAPEEKPSRRQESSRDLRSVAADEPAAVPDAAPSVAAGETDAGAGLTDRVVGPATVALSSPAVDVDVPAKAQTAQTRRAIAPAAPAAATLNEQTMVLKARSAPREVRVEGLATEQLIKVEVRLDDSGRVIEATIVGVRDPKIVDAVKKVAKDWTFTFGADDTGRARSTRTIDVQLRKDD